MSKKAVGKARVYRLVSVKVDDAVAAAVAWYEERGWKVTDEGATVRQTSPDWVMVSLAIEGVA